MNQEKLNLLAIELMRLGISQAGVAELMATSSIEEIERQLLYLPHRKAKRPSAFLIEAVRNKYSPPKEFYAQAQTHTAATRNPLDEDPALAGGSPDAQAQGYGAASSASSSSPGAVSEALGHEAINLVIPVLDREDGSSIRSDQQRPDEPVSTGAYPQS